MGPAKRSRKRKVPPLLAACLPKTAAFLSQLWTRGLRRLADGETGLLAAVKDDAARLLETLLNDPELPLQLPQAQPGEHRSGRQPKMVLTLLADLRGFEGCGDRKLLQMNSGAAEVCTTPVQMAAASIARIFGGGCAGNSSLS